jgi:hypothetical protein
MQAISLRTSIPKNRRLRLTLPPEITPGPAEILVVIQPTVQPQMASSRPLTIDDLGWSQAKAAVVREQLASFVEDWDDPRLDVYNVLPE